MKNSKNFWIYPFWKISSLAEVRHLAETWPAKIKVAVVLNMDSSHRCILPRNALHNVQLHSNAMRRVSARSHLDLWLLPHIVLLGPFHLPTQDDQQEDAHDLITHL